MLKVATPILYESSLDELNRVRPLKLSDRNRLFLDLPVLCKNPVGTGRPIVSKFSRCDEQGALLRRNNKHFNNYQGVELNVDNYDPRLKITFNQKVFGCMVKILGSENLIDFCLMDFRYGTVLATFSSDEFLFVPFNGLDLYFMGDGEGDWWVVAHLYGFY